MAHRGIVDHLLSHSHLVSVEELVLDGLESVLVAVLKALVSALDSFIKGSLYMKVLTVVKQIKELLLSGVVGCRLLLISVNLPSIEVFNSNQTAVVGFLVNHTSDVAPSHLGHSHGSQGDETSVGVRHVRRYDLAELKTIILGNCRLIGLEAVSPIHQIFKAIVFVYCFITRRVSPGIRREDPLRFVLFILVVTHQLLDVLDILVLWLF